MGEAYYEVMRRVKPPDRQDHRLHARVVQPCIIKMRCDKMARFSALI
jgi:hypothetical protein